MKKLFSLTLSLLMLIACSLVRCLPLRQRERSRPPWTCGTAQ